MYLINPYKSIGKSRNVITNNSAFIFQRLIVEFSLENKVALLTKEKRQERLKVGQYYLSQTIGANS